MNKFKNEVWFEIGITKEFETETIFSANSLQKCLKEWIKEGYTKKTGYFIDIWTYDKQETPLPIGNIDIYEHELPDIHKS